MNDSSANELPLGKILQGDCVELLDQLPEKSIDLIFADPPYNLQLQQELYRPNHTLVDAVQDGWDQFSGFAEYDQFSRRWLSACRRVLKDSGTLWVIGTYHNIYRLGTILQDLGFWFLNDIVWIKTNPMPNFRGVRFTNAHETLLWVSKSKESRYTFNHHTLKALNDDLQMRSDWYFPICNGSERLRENGKKLHSTQKPEALLYRILEACSRPGDIILDPFFGSGTTGAMAQKLNRRWIGIERESKYIELATRRIAAIQPLSLAEEVLEHSPRRSRSSRIPFGRLLEEGLLHPGQTLYFRRRDGEQAIIRADGSMISQTNTGSIHRLASQLLAGSPCNGWDLWLYENEQGDCFPIDDLRQKLRRMQDHETAESDSQ